MMLDFIMIEMFAIFIAVVMGICWWFIWSIFYELVQDWNEHTELLVEREDEEVTYGICLYHGIECDYKGNCIDCPHDTEEDVEWFKLGEEREESEVNNDD